ncbi:hypothetical protein CMT41_07380 [Colwellia sp. MT41]|nr:hypothetical protein CMT41_07380 [Colwellia sp. MT41]
MSREINKNDLAVVKKKINKYLALAARNSSEHEATQAMIRASKMMEAYGLIELDLDKAKEDMNEVEHLLIFNLQRERSLVNAIARNLGIFTLYMPMNESENKWSCITTFVGEQFGIDTALVTFEAAQNIIQTMRYKYLEDKLKTNEPFNDKTILDYGDGLISGLIKRFDVLTNKRATTNIQTGEARESLDGKGLVPVNQMYSTAVKWSEAQNGGVHDTSPSIEYNVNDDYRNGVVDSKKINLNNALN